MNYNSAVTVIFFPRKKLYLRPTLTDEYTGKSRIVEEINMEIKVILSKNVSRLVKYS